MAKTETISKPFEGAISNLRYVDCGTISGTSDGAVLEQALNYALSVITDAICVAIVNVTRAEAWPMFGIASKRGSSIAGYFVQAVEGKLYLAEIVNGTFTLTKTFS